MSARNNPKSYMVFGMKRTYLFAIMFLMPTAFIFAEPRVLENDKIKIDGKNTVGKNLPQKADSTSISLNEFIYDGHGKKDPFAAPIIGPVEDSKEKGMADIKIEGIIWDEKTPIVVINNKILGVGDYINGAKILEIKENEVILDSNGEKVVVKLILDKS